MQKAELIELGALSVLLIQRAGYTITPPSQRAIATSSPTATRVGKPIKRRRRKARARSVGV